MFEYQSPYKKKIKLYADGADYDSMLKLAADPTISGLTTNPSLMKKAGIKEYTPFCKSILEKIKDKPISFEVFADDFPTMEKQAREIATWGENVYVKIPVMNSKGESSIALIQSLSQEKIKLNLTAIFTLDQVYQVCEAVKGGAPSVVSVFAGRVADTGFDAKSLMSAASGICTATDPNIELLWASTREVYNIIDAEETGCDIITVPPAILSKLKNFGKSLLESSKDTVLAFKKDAEAAGFQI